MQNRPGTPTCPECGRPMQLNTAVSDDEFQQYLCSHKGQVYHHNIRVNVSGKTGNK